jgi:hypothetical protein
MNRASDVQAVFGLILLFPTHNKTHSATTKLLAHLLIIFANGGSRGNFAFIMVLSMRTSSM